MQGTYDYLEHEKRLDIMKYEIIDFLETVHVDPRFAIKMFETQNSKMLFPNLSDLLIWRVISSLEPPESLRAIINAREVK